MMISDEVFELLLPYIDSNFFTGDASNYGLEPQSPWYGRVTMRFDLFLILMQVEGLIEAIPFGGMQLLSDGDFYLDQTGISRMPYTIGYRWELTKKAKEIFSVLIL